MPSRRYAWTVVMLLWFAFGMSYVDRQLCFSMFPKLRAELGFSEAELGLVGSVFIWVSSVSMPFAGRLADLVRRERMVTASLVLWSLATFASGQSGSSHTFLIWRGVLGLMEALYFPAAVALIADLHPGASRSTALALHQSAQLFGTIGGGWYGGWAADRIGWRFGFTIIALAGIGYAFILLIAFRNCPARAVRDGAKNGNLIPLARSRCYQALSLSFLAFCASLWIIYAWLPDFIYHRYHLSMATSGFVATVYLQLSTALGVLIGGGLADRLSHRIGPARFYVLAAGALLSAPFSYLMFAASSTTELKLFSAAFGLFAGLFIGNLFASAYDVIPERHYGVAAGILNTIGGISAGAGVLLIGIFKETAGYKALVAIGAAGTITMGVLLLIVVKRHFAAEHRSAKQADARANAMAEMNMP